MAYSATISQLGGIITFTDTSTISGSLVSRILIIKDPNDVVLATINMGVVLIATYTITSDQYLKFVETIVDGSGSHTVEEDYMSVYFYVTQFLAIMKQLGCCRNTPVFNQLNEAGNYYDAANDYALTVDGGILANLNIIAANKVLNG
jgi:hypothetical protein